METSFENDQLFMNRLTFEEEANYTEKNVVNVTFGIFEFRERQKTERNESINVYILYLLDQGNRIEIHYRGVKTLNWIIWSLVDRNESARFGFRLKHIRV